ncbi:MAG: hypothetical protein A2Y73_04495 [Chloroflexi bacterium RBG_13_56_8]|nr:MAG: hypothetical protein A2Y73_04495 [Chloroflexi bacterium RBG_13_56_8]
MTWSNVQAIPIFAPCSEPYGDNWVEQILGTTLKPLHQQFTDSVRWLWATRYSGLYSNENPPVGCALPEEYQSDGRYRYIMVRASAEEAFQKKLQYRSIELASEAGCYTDPRGWVDYDVVADLGSNRYIREEATPEQRVQRAKLVAYFIDATVKLMLDMLAQDEKGRWRFELSTHEQNPKGSVFESVHHLFCNATCAPTTVLVSHKDNQLGIGTYWMEYWSTIAVEPDKDWRLEFPLKY